MIFFSVQVSFCCVHVLTVNSNSGLAEFAVLYHISDDRLHRFSCNSSYCNCISHIYKLELELYVATKIKHLKFFESSNVM